MKRTSLWSHSRRLRSRSSLQGFASLPAGVFHMLPLEDSMMEVPDTLELMMNLSTAGQPVEELILI